MAALVEESAIDDLRDVYGCPDCTDGGAEWVEVETSESRKRVTFEFGDGPKELESLVRELRALRQQFPPG